MMKDIVGQFMRPGLIQDIVVSVNPGSVSHMFSMRLMRDEGLPQCAWGIVARAFATVSMLFQSPCSQRLLCLQPVPYPWSSPLGSMIKS